MSSIPSLPPAAPDPSAGGSTLSDQQKVDIRGLFDEFMKDSTLFPGEFKSFLKKWVEGEQITIAASQVTGLSAFVGGVIPIGGYFGWPSDTLPSTDFLWCDGAAVDRIVYDDLFTAIGTTWGVGDGSTTFNLPPFKGRVLVMKDAAQAEFDTLTETGGVKTHPLTTAELSVHQHPNTVAIGTLAGAIGTLAATAGSLATNTTGSGHKHIGADAGAGTFTDHYVINQMAEEAELLPATAADGTHTHGVTGTPALTGVPSVTGAPAITNVNAGSGTAHQNLQPYIISNWIIRAQ